MESTAEAVKKMSQAISELESNHRALSARLIEKNLLPAERSRLEQELLGMEEALKNLPVELLKQAGRS